MRSSDIREIFFSYFNKRGHYKVLSAPLIPAKDPTLLFTNAGMNQFKDVFLGNEKREYRKAVSIQKCMRVSGKHNDFDEVGRTEYHHTFFEMLGNFSFGDYFKEKAIEYAWELLTAEFKFRPEDLWVSVYKDDDEAFRIWEENIGIPQERIVRLGEKDNFWQMGDTGPCGPCSEIHFDRGESYGPAEFTDGNKRFVEIWNLVFMQYFKDKSGKMNPLPSPSIDTGMGMERLTTLLSGVSSNYETDLFLPIIKNTAQIAGIDPKNENFKVGLNVIADHVRALSFLISDGVLPSNEGRGYILRRLLRRASKHGRSLGLKGRFLYELVPSVIEIMKDSYSELEHNRKFIAEVITSEEDRFDKTLLNGLKRFEELMLNTIEKGKKTIPGTEIFKLSDTYGFPLDFSIDLANEKNIKIDIEGFHKELTKQQDQSRKHLASKGSGDKFKGKMDTEKSVFTGYDSLEDEGKITAVFSDNIETEKISAGEKGIIILDRTPFYGESGGQKGDIGIAKNENAFCTIVNTLKNNSGGHLHFIEVESGSFKTGDSIRLKVDRKTRQNTAIHHSSTHLLHAALREVLGFHVKQSGSYVGPEKLRFDFTHYKSPDKKELEQIENIINNKIRENLEITTEETSYEDAIKRGAIAIFEEKYSHKVRLVTMEDFSKELCGGNHLKKTGEIGYFKILSESSISSGVRRIEAVAGEAGNRYISEAFNSFNKLESHFKQKGENLYKFLSNMEKSFKELEKSGKTDKKIPKIDTKGILENSITSGEISYSIEHLDGVERKGLSSVSDELARKSRGISVLSTNLEDKSAIVISIHEHLTKKFNASTIIKEIASLVEGSGGGRADFAQAGGITISDPELFKEKVKEILLEK
ncbi:MAG: alanine--tRNA ligase [Acidobacteriota bacterium]